MQLNGYQKIVLKKEERPVTMDYLFWLSQAFSSCVWLQPAAASSSCLPYSYSPSYHEFLPTNLLMLLLCSSFLRMCYCTQGRLYFCGYMRGSSQLSSGSTLLRAHCALPLGKRAWYPAFARMPQNSIFMEFCILPYIFCISVECNTS